MRNLWVFGGWMWRRVKRGDEGQEREVGGRFGGVWRGDERFIRVKARRVTFSR